MTPEIIEAFGLYVVMPIAAAVGLLGALYLLLRVDP